VEFRPGKRFMLTFFLLATVAPPLTELGSALPLHVQHNNAVGNGCPIGGTGMCLPEMGLAEYGSAR
jgi:hypothetical protein